MLSSFLFLAQSYFTRVFARTGGLDGRLFSRGEKGVLVLSTMSNNLSALKSKFVGISILLVGVCFSVFRLVLVGGLKRMLTFVARRQDERRNSDNLKDLFIKVLRMKL